MTAKPKAKMGRPSNYKADYAKQAAKLCELGATDAEVADFFEVSLATITNWKAKHPDFVGALKSGKAVSDERVERSLYHRAVGYKHDAVKIFMPAGAKAPVYAPYVEHIPPDTTACIFWLKNRRPALWRDVQKHEIGGVGDFSNMGDDELARNLLEHADALGVNSGLDLAEAAEVLSGMAPGNETVN